MAIVTITRTYNTKHGVVTKTYQYDNTKYVNKTKANKPKVDKVITKKGTLSKRIEKIINSIDDVEEQEYIKAQIKKTVKAISRGELEAHSYTLSNFKTMYEANRLQIFLDNMGASVQQIVNELHMEGDWDVDDVWILNNSHWKFRKAEGMLPTLMLPSGRKACFEFRYHDGFDIIVEGANVNA